MQVNLFEKTELWITDIFLKEADLGSIAALVADILKLDKEKVFVVDVRPSHIVLDIIEKKIPAGNLFGKKEEILRELKNLRGVTITPDTDFHSNGILGSVVLDKWTADSVLTKSESISKEIEGRIRKRAIVFATGFEVKEGMIKDTNTSYIAGMLESEGYHVKHGGILDDDLNMIAGKINEAVDNGYGLIITSGGVGAEDKDRTVEGILKVDPQAAVPYLVKFEKGKGRHEKDGVRIAVGQVEYSMIAALPGPNDEVRAAMPALLAGLKTGADKTTLSNRITSVLREKYKYHSHHHHNEHNGRG